ncbi:unnamed protein product [Rotaria sordida]|uniref:C3H1-type domain-containing protein n=1 Tax=Rotaria sordida TaxID=392033 RepID=A0A818IWN5_9BILA|nr:unnamed protein product [Rotaria sordida]CAF3528572.1 unnamed protein product [Rotaria sordida]
MDIDIVNAVLRLCYEQQTCLFEVPILCDYCLEQRLCTNSKHVLASIKNYMEIFKISRDRNRIEFFMPFEICRNNFHDGLCQNNGESCSNLHVCYEYFNTNSCRRSINCPYPHMLIQKYHENILGTLIHLDLDALTKAFRIYCQLKKHLLNYNSSSIPSLKVQQHQQQIPSSSFTKNSTYSSLSSFSSSFSTNNKRWTVTSQIHSNTSWKTNNRTLLTSTNLPTQQQQQIISQISEKGLQIYWTPSKEIQTHFIEVAFSNHSKCDGGPIRTHTIYQHLGIAQVFYKNSDTVDRVIDHESITFQTFTFIPRLLQRTVDMRHVCFINMSIETNRIPLYIDIVSKPHKKTHYEYYQNDKQTILVEYNEDIDFSKISSNVRNHPEYNGLQIKCIQLYYPETLLIEYDQQYSEYDIKNLFKNERIFHIKIYSFCAFVHFYCHDDLIRSIKTPFDDPIRVIPIYIDIYSQQHLDNYLQRRHSEVQSKILSIENQPILSTTDIITQELSISVNKNDLLLEPEPSVPILPLPTTNQQIEILSELKLPITTESSSLVSLKPSEILYPKIESICTIEANNDIDDENENDIENEIRASDDDFDDLPSDFDNNDLFLDESMYDYGDMEFIRNAAKNLISSLADMEEASNDLDQMDEPQSILYGDDYVVTIKCRRFALAFLDYTQYRIEKQRNPDRFRLLSSLKRNINNNVNQKQQQIDHKQCGDISSSPISNIDPDLLISTEMKSNKKKRNKRNKNKKKLNNNHNDNKDKTEPIPESINEEDEDDNNVHILNDHGHKKQDISTQRLPHVYFDDDLKPCIVVVGEEHNEENGQETNEYEDWHNIIAGGKQVLVSKKKKQSSKINSIEHSTITNLPLTTNIRLKPQATEYNSLIIPNNCRGFIHNSKLYETFRLRLRRSFPSINIYFQSDTYTIIIDGNIKLNIQQCLNYLNKLNSYKHNILISYENFPQTTITNIMRMQQSTAQIKLDSKANYNRIFRSTYRLIDYHLKQYYNQQQCIYCRRSKKKFQITYLEFPCEKQSIDELNNLIEQRVLQLLNIRFTYIAIALSADLMTTKRWAIFYKNLTKHKELNKTLLIRKINTIIQVYGLHANVQQVQTLLTKFLDANRYEIDVIETEQPNGIYSLFKHEFEEMKNLDIFRDAELRFIYRHHRHILLVQCFQEKFEMVKGRIQKMRSQLLTTLLPVKSPILSRYYSRSNEIQRIAAASTCTITAEQRIDHNRPNDYLINLKIIGRSPDKIDTAQRLIKEFEEQKYSTRKIHNNDINLFTEQDIELFQNECNTCNVSCTIDQTHNSIELEGLSGDFIQIEKMIYDLCLIVARRALDDIQYSTQWIYYDISTNKPIMYDKIIQQQLENCYTKKQKGLINLKDQLGYNHIFNFDKMIEITQGKNLNSSPITINIERRDFKNPQSIQLPTHWTPMTKPWDRVLLGRRDNINEWKVNTEIQRLLQLPEMLSESWIIEIHRIQNPRLFQQYVAYKEKLAARSQDTERILYRLAQVDLIDDMCANGFNESHNDSAFSAYGHGCHYYCKAKEINRTATLLAQSHQTIPIRLQQQQTPSKSPRRYLFVCKVLVGRYTRGDPSMKTCPPGYDSLVDNILSPEVFVPSHDTQVLPEYLIAYQSDIF